MPKMSLDLQEMDITVVGVPWKVFQLPVLEEACVVKDLLNLDLLFTWGWSQLKGFVWFAKLNPEKKKQKKNYTLLFSCLDVDMAM